MKKGLLFVVLGVIFASCGRPQKMDVYLCIGQSNMAGRATIDRTVQDTLTGVFLLTNDPEQLWEKAANPLNKYSSIRKGMGMQKLGPSYGFAEAMRKMKPDTRIGLVVNAKGGTSIRQWHPDSVFFKEAVRRTKIAMQHGQLKGVIWHQGCSDASKWKAYMPQLKNMVSHLRDELGNNELPFVVGQLSSDKSFRNSFNDMLLEVPTQIKHAAVVSSEGLTTIDKTHFDTQSQMIIGKRYAVKMQALQEEKK